MTTALLLPGGGARGIVQFGMLKRVQELVDAKKLTIDMVFATSVGAYNGAFFQSGQLDVMESFWLRIRNGDVYSFAPWKMLTEFCLYDTSPLRRNLEKYLSLPRFYNNRRPFYVNVTSRANFSAETWLVNVRDQHYLPKGMLAMTALMASGAAPIAFPAVNGYVDGGVMNNYSISTAIDQGADHLIVLAPTIPPKFQPKSMLDILDFMLSAPEWGYLAKEMDMAKRVHGVRVDLVIPEHPVPVGLLDFNGLGSKATRQGYITQGYNLAQAALG